MKPDIAGSVGQLSLHGGDAVRPDDMDPVGKRRLQFRQQPGQSLRTARRFVASGIKCHHMAAQVRRLQLTQGGFHFTTQVLADQNAYTTFHLSAPTVMGKLPTAGRRRQSYAGFHRKPAREFRHVHR